MIGYPLLSDPNSAIIRDFGLFDDRYRPGSWAYGVARPVILVLDADGFVRHRFSEADYRRRPGPDLVFEALRAAAG